MTRAQKRILFAAVLVAAVVVTAAIGHAGGPEIVKAAPRQAAVAVGRSDAVAFESERAAGACPSIPSGLFGEPVGTPAPKKPEKPPIPPAKPVAVLPTPDPLADYRYTGLTGSGDDAAALVEHTKTKEGHYVRAGEPFLGGTVVAVTADAVTVRIGAEARSLPRYDRYTLVPLDKDAPNEATQVVQQSEPSSVLVDLSNSEYYGWTRSRLLTTRLHSYITAYSLQLRYGHSNEEAMNQQFEGR